MGDTQRLNDTQQLEILALLEAASTERSAMRAARALAELMRHLHALGQRIAGELPDQDRDASPTISRASSRTSGTPPLRISAAASLMPVRCRAVITCSKARSNLPPGTRGTRARSVSLP
jgi:hypothetical protein